MTLPAGIRLGGPFYFVPGIDQFAPNPTRPAAEAAAEEHTSE